MLIFFPKSPDQNSEIAILFSIIEKPNNYLFADDLLLHSPRGRGCTVISFDQCLNIVIVIGKCTDAYRGFFFGWGRELGEGVMRRDLCMEEFFMGKKISMKGGAGLFSIFFKEQ